MPHGLPQSKAALATSPAPMNVNQAITKKCNKMHGTHSTIPTGHHNINPQHHTDHLSYNMYVVVVVERQRTRCSTLTCNGQPDIIK